MSQYLFRAKRRFFRELFFIREWINSNPTKVAACSSVPLEDMIFIIEPNLHHYELLPPLVKTCLATERKVTVVVRNKAEAIDALQNDSGQVVLMELTLSDIKRLVNALYQEPQATIIFGSSRVDVEYVSHSSVLDFFFPGMYPQCRLGLVHHRYDICNTAISVLNGRNIRHFVLAEPFPDGAHVFSAVDFPVPDTVIESSKSASTRSFLTVRSFKGSFRDLSPLLTIANDTSLTRRGIFHLVGSMDKAAKAVVTTSLAVKAHGRLPFFELYALMNQVDFLLPLLDSTNSEHSKMRRGQFSGMRQLAIGFQVPMVLDEEFARVYGFDDGTAILYRPGDLQAGVSQALQMKTDELSRMRTSLVRMARRLKNKNASEMEEFLSTPPV